MTRYKPQGWKNESQRHSMASQGISSTINNDIPIPIRSPRTILEGYTDDTLTETDDIIDKDELTAGEGAKELAKGVGQRAIEGTKYLGSAFSEGLRSVFGEEEAQVQQQIMQDMDSVVMDEDGDPIISIDGTPKTKKQIEVERELEELEEAQMGGVFTSDYRTQGEEKRETVVDKIKDFLDFGKVEEARENIYGLKGQQHSYNDKISILQTIRQDVMSTSNRNAKPINEQFTQINQINNAIGELESDKRRLEDDISHMKNKFNKKIHEEKNGIKTNNEPSFMTKLFDPNTSAEDLF